MPNKNELETAPWYNTKNELDTEISQAFHHMCNVQRKIHILMYTINIAPISLLAPNSTHEQINQPEKLICNHFCSLAQGEAYCNFSHTSFQGTYNSCCTRAWTTCQRIRKDMISYSEQVTWTQCFREECAWPTSASIISIMQSL